MVVRITKNPLTNVNGLVRYLVRRRGLNALATCCILDAFFVDVLFMSRYMCYCAKNIILSYR